jgi:hypothetical protein
VVTFDLELGQAMEMIYPGHVKLSESEKMNICYLSFPDSNSGCMGDTQFHFRIRQCPGRKVLHASYTEYNRSCPTALQTDAGYFYGYVYFRQIKDRSIRRGYFQKSVVLISRLPFVALFNYVVGVIAPEFFDTGLPCLEAACHNIDQWLAPLPGETINLPLIGSVIQVSVPSRSDKLLEISAPKSLQTTLPHLSPAANVILPSVYEVNMFTAFQTVLPHIQLFWELVLTAEPVVVMTSVPTLCASVVQALVNMIQPLRYSADFRPFFTIHDSDFKEYTTKTQSPPSVILGVTNPFFVKTLQHWPHVVRIGEMTEVTISRTLDRLKPKTKTLKTLDCKPGVYTCYKPFLTKDTTILKRLAKGLQSRRPVEAQDALLKSYLLKLTNSFMNPLESYLGTLMPPLRCISPHKSAPCLKPFSPDEFFKMIDQNKRLVTSALKGDLVGLYQKFFQCANFECWLQYRLREINQKLQALHIQAMCQADLVTWIQDKKEVEIVDLVLRLREKLACLQSSLVPLPADTAVKLRSHIDNIISCLPPDLQSVLA